MGVCVGSCMLRMLGHRRWTVVMVLVCRLPRYYALFQALFQASYLFVSIKACLYFRFCAPTDRTRWVFVLAVACGGLYLWCLLVAHHPAMHLPGALYCSRASNYTSIIASACAYDSTIVIRPITLVCIVRWSYLLESIKACLYYRFDKQNAIRVVVLTRACSVC